jgi:hypothetical protein
MNHQGATKEIMETKEELDIPVASNLEVEDKVPGVISHSLIVTLNKSSEHPSGNANIF